EALQNDLIETRRQLAVLRDHVAMTEFVRNLDLVKDVAGIPVLTVQLSGADVNSMRQMTDRFRQRYPSGVAVLASVLEDRAMLIAAVTDDLVERGLKAGDLIASIGGKGGGRPNLAQGSLPNGDVGEALGKLPKVIEERIK
ncbi:MAG: DHHA1 domain-containing protein, partial [Anaerolineales bacterium]|nr:DHHA1 domain-containing protein [Anaerolineales bacterium]